MIRAVLSLLAAAAAAGAQGLSLSSSTSFGGRDADFGNAVAVDRQGNVYVAGETHSTDFPVVRPAQAACALGALRSCADAFLIKLAPGGQVVYSTFYGTTGNEAARAVAVDARGYAYIAGTSGSYGFVARFDPEGKLVYGRSLGGYPVTMAHGVAADEEGNAWVVGTTLTNTLEIAGPAFQPQPGGGSCAAVGDTAPFTTVVDAFLARISPSGQLLYSSYLGGSGFDDAKSVALDRQGNVYVAGVTSSRDFPVVGGFQREYRGGDPKGTGHCEGDDAFLAAFNPDGSQLRYSTYLGGSRDEEVSGVALDGAGLVYLAGTTRSPDFPVVRALAPAPRGGRDLFVAKLDAAGGGLVYSTYLGGSADEYGGGIAVDASGHAHIAGGSDSIDFPTANPVQSPGGGSCGPAACTDFVVARLSAAGESLDYATHLGGAFPDFAYGIALGGAGTVFVAGWTYERSFPSAGPSPLPGGRFSEVAIARLEFRGGAAGLGIVSGASFAAGAAIAPDSIASAFGEGLASVAEGAVALPLPERLGDRRVQVIDGLGASRTAPLFYVSGGQINFLVPAGTRPGMATIRVLGAEDEPIAEGSVQIEKAAPGLFTTTADGKGVAAATLARSADGALLVVLYGTGIRGASSVQARVGGQAGVVEYAGPQASFAGLDQVNIRVFAPAAGRLEVEIIVDGKPANRVFVDVT